MGNNHPNRNWRKRWPDEAAAYVRAWRAVRGFTQEEAGVFLGVSVRAVQEWEAGRNIPPEYLRLALKNSK